MVGMELVITPAPTFGERITQARQYRNLSQDQFAAAVGTTRRTVWSWEHNKTSPDIEQFLKMLPVLRVPLGWFFDGLVPDDPDGSDAAGVSVGNHHSNVVNLHPSLPGITPARPALEPIAS